MSHLIITADIHGLAGRDADLRELLAEHASGLVRADGCLGALASAPLGADPGEYVLAVRWRDEAALRATTSRPSTRATSRTSARCSPGPATCASPGSTERSARPRTSRRTRRARA